ncbi:MAG: S8 family serine peptidase [Thiolinea sp.]
MKAFHAQGYTGAGIRVGCLDTGVMAAHPLLKGRVRAFCHIDRFGEPDECTEARDLRGHGTHLAGIITQVAPGALLYCAEVLEGGYSVWRILRGIDWLIRQKVHIVLLPIGLMVMNPVFWSAVSALVSRGILPVAAVGNGGAGKAYSPGWYPHVLSVGATDFSGRVAKFSGSYNKQQFCLKPDLVAPGVGILSADITGNTVMRSGTSMASAVVAGLAALLWSRFPSADGTAIKKCLLDSCIQVSAEQSHRARCGQLCLSETLQVLQDSPEFLHEWPDTDIPAIPEYYDPYLEKQLEYASNENIPVVVLAVGETIPLIIQRVEHKAGAALKQCTVLHRFNAALLLATKHLLRAIKDEPNIRVMVLPEVMTFQATVVMAAS